MRPKLTPLFIMLLTTLVIAATAAAQYGLSSEDAALLEDGNNAFLNAQSLQFDLAFNLTLPDGVEINLDGPGVYQAATGGFLGIGSNDLGIKFDLNGSMNLLGNSAQLYAGFIVDGNTLYISGLTEDEWASVPMSAAFGQSFMSFQPPNTDPTFITVTRLPDATLNGEAVAEYQLDYDLNNPVIQQAITQATADVQSFGGAIATGGDAAAVFANADMTVVQSISLDGRQLRRMVITYNDGETEVTVQADVTAYDDNVTIEVPDGAQAFAPGDLGLGG